MRYLIAVDPRLTCSGWALFDLKTANPLATGIILPLPATFSLEHRINLLQQEVKRMFISMSLDKRDYFVSEGPAPLVLNPDSALKVERVRGVFEAVARETALNVVGRLNPRTVQTELLGFKGKQIERKEVKKIARQVALNLFPSFLASKNKVTQDEIDALLVGALAASKIKIALSSKLSPELVFATKARRSRSIRWKESDLIRKNP